MADCPIADECPGFSERIEGMGCQYYGDRGGKEWCNNYNQPIEELKTAPVVPGEEIVIDVEDMHESGAGVGRHEGTGFIVMVDGVLPPARVRAEVTNVKSNYARADLIEKLPDEDGEVEDATAADTEGRESGEEEDDPRLGSRENFWGS
ncbi:TRAM domain-containing protein [Salarchaeum sp. JOR-1]|uniref:TRAM domain-containing protein n=1 Tax=Salarchaeum sp. JOR-1 TaxID=2599399 RepID=UPI001198943F|nr:TRAM domain-containing protein [Salarchaeum sp. JOR-1]QDX40358.1 TRAM domain-containing protein [Salarchaeum sp. JOR-1]